MFLRKSRNVRNLIKNFSFTFSTNLEKSGDTIILWHQDVYLLLVTIKKIGKIEGALSGLK